MTNMPDKNLSRARWELEGRFFLTFLKCKIISANNALH